MNKTLTHIFSNGNFWAFVSMICYGLTNFFVRMAVIDIEPMLGNAIRLIPLVVLSTFIMFITKPDKIKFSIQLQISLVGILMYCIGNGVFFTAMKLGGAAITTSFSATQVLWSVIIAKFLLNEKLNKGMVSGAITIIVGLSVVSIGQNLGITLTDLWYIAIPLAILAGLCWAFSGNYTRYFTEHGVGLGYILLIGSIAGFIASNVYLLITGNIDQYLHLNRDTVFILVIAGILDGTAMACFSKSLSLVNVANTTSINSFNMVITSILTYLFLNDTLNFIMLIGIVLVIAGITILQKKMRSE